MKSHIVIGSGYGDEGKGLTTDWLTHNCLGDCLVVRHNGGGQAGHTVELADGTKHVFKHIGSGMFNKADTFLSEYFIVNPSIFINELASLSECELLEKIGIPAIYVDSSATITVPFDTLINVELEHSRGNAKHGSCGAGINETVTRSENEKYKIMYGDLHDERLLRYKFELIRDEYVPQRCAELNISIPTDIIQGSYEFFFTECEFIKNVCRIGTPSSFHAYDHVIFEGAQGLLLDEDHENFPHVTRSKTGITNAVELLKSIGERSAEVYYVTRTYATRHGAGPLGHEDIEIPYCGEDKTNITNPSQGSLRCAPLDLNLLRNTIENDINSVTDFTIRSNLMVTHVNKLPDVDVKYVDFHGYCTTGSKTNFLYKLKYNCGVDCVLFSYSPTREDVVEVW